MLVAKVRLRCHGYSIELHPLLYSQHSDLPYMAHNEGAVWIATLMHLFKSYPTSDTEDIAHKINIKVVVSNWTHQLAMEIVR